MLGLDHTIWELSMEQLGPLGEIKMSLVLHILGIEKVVLFFWLNIRKSNPLGTMQLAWIELRRLNALPFKFMHFLGKILTDHPLDLLKR